MADADVTNFPTSAKRPRYDSSVDQTDDPNDSPITTQNIEDQCVEKGNDERNTTSGPTEVECDEELETSHDSVSGDDEGENKDEEDSDSDNMSEISDLSGLSEAGWRPIAGPIAWVQKQMFMGANPREILKDLISSSAQIPEDVSDMILWRIIVNIMSEPAKRSKISHINTLDDAVHLLRTCKKVMVLTGAGVSVPCGIPDFRSRDGVYARLAVDFPDLREPQDMFDIRYFTGNPRPFFKFAKEIYPGQFKPSRSHQFIRKIEENGKLLRNYTQNIDTLEQVAGIQNVIQCHGSFATATCMTCKYNVDADGIRDDIMNQLIPRCPKCGPDSTFPVMKPDIVFFGEGLPDEFHQKMEDDKDECDLLIVIGSSLKVRPVALIPNSLPANVPQVLINREPLKHLNFDIELLGDCDVIVNELCHRLGDKWNEMCVNDHLEEVSRDDLLTPPPVAQSSLPFPRNVSSISNVSDTAGVRTELEGIHLQVGEETSNSSNNNVSDCEKSSEKVTWSLGQLPDEDMIDGKSSVETKSAVRIIEDSGTCSRDSGAYDMSTGTETDTDHPSDNDSRSPRYDDEGSRPNSDDGIEVMRSMWQPKRLNISDSLPERSFLFLPPNRYVFPGAEVCEGEADDGSDKESVHSFQSEDGDDQKMPPSPQYENGKINIGDSLPMKKTSDVLAKDTFHEQTSITEECQ